MKQTQETLDHLIKNIKDVQHKPILRGTLEAEMLKLKCPEAEVTEVLDKLFRTTVH